MYCNKCGNVIPDDCAFCTSCGANRVQPDQPLPGGGAAVAAQKNGLYGDFGGLIISGALVFIFFLIGGLMMPGIFASGPNLVNVVRQIAVLLPVGFAAALTVRTKGLDLSFVAMAELASVIMMGTDSLGAGAAVALIVCVGIGAVNAVLIHYLKLPALIVTLAMMLVVGVIADVLGINATMRPIELSTGWLWVVVLIAVVIAAAVGLLTTPRSKERLAAHVLPVYAASGLFAVLYVAAMALRVRAITSVSAPFNLLLFVGLLMGIMRYHKTKALGAVFSIVPLLAFALLMNVMNLAAVSAYWQTVVMTVFILVLIAVIFGRGRAAVAGHNLDDGGAKRAWIALLPLIVILLVYPLFSTILIMAIGQPSALYDLLTGLIAQIVLLLVIAGCGVWYALGRRQNMPFS